MDAYDTIPEGPDALRHHGGSISAARYSFPGAPEPWIDLSTGINPVPYEVGAIASSAWFSLPERSDVAALEAVARSAYGAGPSVEVVAAPGTQALIQWLPRLFPARRVAVLGFTYAEHETCWRQAGAQVTIVETISGLTEYDVGVIVNPNNPDGRMLPPGLMIEAAETLATRGGLLVVDEAFVDAIGSRYSLVPALPVSGAIVLRSFGKIYGLAGLRLGFAITTAAIGAALRTAVGPWAVSGPAIAIGRQAMADDAWLAVTGARLANEATRLDRLLQLAGLEIVGGTPLFRLARQKPGAAWFEKLGRAGILTRPFNHRPDWLRFGVPHEAAAWERLEAALLTTAAHRREVRPNGQTNTSPTNNAHHTSTGCSANRGP